MGDVMSVFLGARKERQNGKMKQFDKADMMVRMDCEGCEGCELRVRNILVTMKGVQSVYINRKQQKVTVQGFVETQRLLRQIQSSMRKHA